MHNAHTVYPGGYLISFTQLYFLPPGGGLLGPVVAGHLTQHQDQAWSPVSQGPWMQERKALTPYLPRLLDIVHFTFHKGRVCSLMPIKYSFKEHFQTQGCTIRNSMPHSASAFPAKDLCPFRVLTPLIERTALPGQWPWALCVLMDSLAQGWGTGKN